MTSRTRRAAMAAAAALLAVVGPLTACTVTPSAQGGGSTANPFAPDPEPSPTSTDGPGPVPPDPRLATFYDQSLTWAGCGGGFECATLTVPVSYDDPEGPTIGISVLRAPAEGGDPIGSLVLNPGGPGGSGVNYARAARAVVGPRLRQEFDIVGFDPRGVASSAPVDCLTDEQTDRLYAADAPPGDKAELEELVEASAALGIGCQANSGELLPHVGTRDAARDLDILRSALGDEQLYYLGKSYGTYLGAVYAELFPDRVGRLVLDGVLPPDLDAEQITLGQAKAFEVSLRRFAADCPKHSDCPLPANVDAAVAEVQDLLAALDENPLPAQPGRPLNASLATYAVLSYLYFPPSDWPELRQGLAAALKGDGTVLMSMLDRRIQRQSDGSFVDNSADAFYAVSCADRTVVGGVERADELARAWAKEAPTFGPYLAWGNLPCDGWPVAASDEPHVISATGAAPIMVVTTKYDPATPYEWGLSLAEQLDASALVTWDGDGHTAYFNGDTCVDTAVEDYLVDAVVPTEVVACG